MSTSRFGRKWADVDEDDDDTVELKSDAARFETAVDEHGVKTVIEYKEKDGKTYKVTRKVKQTSKATWTNKSINERKAMPNFGKALTDDVSLVVCCRDDVDDVFIGLSKKFPLQSAAKNDAEDKFHEESLALAESLNKEKKVWTDMNRERQLEYDNPAHSKTIDEGKEKTQGAAPATESAAPGKEVGPRAYVPPSLRNDKNVDMAAQQECSLRISNLSSDCRQGDLEDLCGSIGRLRRVYLARDQDGSCKGFAYITYYSREEAQKAIEKLNGHGYDNLILQVQFAKPRA